MDTINASREFLEMVARMGWQSRNIALQIAPLLIIIVAVFGVVKFYFGQEQENKINLNKYLYYNIFMVILLNYYPHVIDITGSFTGILTSAFPRQDTDKMFSEVSKAKIKMYQAQKDGVVRDGDKLSSGMEESLKKSGMNWIQRKAFMYNNNMTWIQRRSSELITEGGGSILDYIKSLLEVSFIRLIRALLEISRNITMSFLIIVGPFALMFEMVPFMRGIATHWYKIFIAASLWLLTLNILDAMYIGFAQARMEEAVGALNTAVTKDLYFNAVYNADGGEAGFLNIVMAICYIFVPYFTTMYAGGQAAQQLFGGVMSMAQFAAVNTASTMMGKVGGSGGIGSGVSSVIGKTTDKT